MPAKEFERKTKEDRPVLAICYDFDKTLSPRDMQAQGYIQSVGFEDVPNFWAESNALAEKNDMDQNVAYMLKMVREAEGKLVFTKQALADYGSRVELFPGVEEWFGRIRAYGEAHGVIVEHYIISSGLKEMIEGTSLARSGVFEKIYASSFYFNEKGIAQWPAQVVNYTNKTQFLFRIEKGILDVNDQGVNEYIPPEKIRVPFRNMVYIGDSETDIPCMKLVNVYGGHSIGVYDPRTSDKSKVYKMIREDRIKYYASADYREGTELDRLVKAIIDRTAANEALENESVRCRLEADRAGYERDAGERRKSDLLMTLENSTSFANTHRILKELSSLEPLLNEEDRRHLFETAVRNDQVKYILSDADVSRFYRRLLSASSDPGAAGRTVLALLEHGA
ncbi:MAG: haloacid dehalogenase-like hydrolase [Lachnospiraceae bacterium]|nr:haloacid dehalogenase-like hydrolase [Lachnospiraceae bacterium]